MLCAQRSYPQRPSRLKATQMAKTVAEMKALLACLFRSIMYQHTPIAKHAICQFKLHNPPRIGPILLMSRGATQVALSSTMVLPVRAMPTCNGV